MGMEEVRISDLIGPPLNWAVAKCEKFGTHYGNQIDIRKNVQGKASCLLVPINREYVQWNPSGDWAQGGPIINRERICLSTAGEHWIGSLYLPGETISQHGPTPLIAAMRCYVAANLGGMVAVPAGVFESLPNQPAGKSEYPPESLTWLFTHCRSIGMDCKSDSGKWEHDIALFTTNQQATIEALHQQLADITAAYIRVTERVHMVGGYLDQINECNQLREYVTLLREKHQELVNNITWGGDGHSYQQWVIEVSQEALDGTEPKEQGK